MSQYRDIARLIARDPETLLTHPNGFGLVTASPMQRAICRIVAGKPLDELASLPELTIALGCAPQQLSGAAPKEIALLSGVRVGKSLITAALALYWTQVCDVSICGPGDHPRVSILSLDKDKAEVVLGHLVGRMKASKYLSALFVTEPSGDEVWVTHPTGLKIEIKVVAGARAGGSLTSRWMPGVIFDEFPRMIGGDEGIVNWTESRKACDQRILPGGGIANIGSPHAPYGPAYEMVITHFGKPTPDLVVLKSPAYDLNPVWWTPERVDKARENPDTFQTEVMGDFASPGEALVPSTWLERSRRHEPVDLPPEWGADYEAGMDPATRGNGWTLVVVTRKGNKRRVVLARQWIGSRSDPLSSRETLTQVRDLLQPYGVTTVWSDRYYIDALRDIALELGLTVIPTFWTDQERTAKYMALRTRFGEGAIELHPDPVLRADLQRLSRRVTQSGVTVTLPRSSDGRHCDYAPALLLAISRYLEDVKEKPAEEDAAVIEAKRQLARALKDEERSVRRPGRLWR